MKSKLLLWIGLVFVLLSVQVGGGVEDRKVAGGGVSEMGGEVSVVEGCSGEEGGREVVWEEGGGRRCSCCWCVGLGKKERKIRKKERRGKE